MLVEILCLCCEVNVACFIGRGNGSSLVTPVDNPDYIRDKESVLRHRLRYITSPLVRHWLHSPPLFPQYASLLGDIRDR